MEKRDFTVRNSIVEEDDDKEVIIEEERVKLEPPASVRLKSQYPGTVIVTGSVTGNRYVFSGAGSELEVNSNDAPKMLEKRFGGNSCCGSGVKPTPHFIVI